MKKIAVLAVLGVVFFTSCMSGPQPGTITLEEIKYIQYGAEELPDIKASYINFISENQAQMIIRSMDNVDLYEMINGASESYSMLTGSKVKPNETIKIVPGEHSFDLVGFTSWGNISYTINFSVKLVMEPGMIYYIYPAEGSSKIVHDSNQFITDVYMWPLGQPERMVSDTITFDLKF